MATVASGGCRLDNLTRSIQRKQNAAKRQGLWLAILPGPATVRDRDLRGKRFVACLGLALGRQMERASMVRRSCLTS